MAVLSLGNCPSEEEAIFQVEAAGSGGGLVPDALLGCRKQLLLPPGSRTETRGVAGSQAFALSLSPCPATVLLSSHHGPVESGQTFGILLFTDGVLNFSPAPPRPPKASLLLPAGGQAKEPALHLSAFPLVYREPS